MISNTDANFLNLHIDKATKTRGDKQLYLITHFTKQTLNLNYFTANVECNGTVLKEPKTEKAILFLNLNSRSKFFQTTCTRYLGIALATHFSSSSLVLGGLNLHSAICFAK